MNHVHIGYTTRVINRRKHMLLQVPKARFVWTTFGSCLILYLVATLSTPTSPELLDRYGISNLTAQLLTLTITVPFVIIWLIALFGYVSFSAYVESIGKGDDEKALQWVKRGLFLLSLWLPVTSILSSFFSAIYRHDPLLRPLFTRLDTYINLIIISLGLLAVYYGSRLLMKLIPKQRYSWRQLLAIATYVVFAIVYFYAALHDPARSVDTPAVGGSTYYLPDTLIVSSILIPRAICWFLSVLAIRNLFVYARVVNGVIYRRGFKYISIGLALILLPAVMVRYAQTFSLLFGSSLKFLLIIVYAFLILMALGYFYVAKGARSLQRIEEV